MVVTATTQPLTNDRVVGREVVSLVVDVSEDDDEIESDIYIGGLIEAIIVKSPSVNDSATLTVTLEDEDDVSYWSQASISASGTNKYYPEVGSGNRRIAVVPPVTVKGVYTVGQVSDRTIDVVVFYSAGD